MPLNIFEKKKATLDMFAKKRCQTYVPSLIKRLQSLIKYFLLDFNPFDIFCHHKIRVWKLGIFSHSHLQVNRSKKF